MRISWPPIIERAAEIVEGYDSLVTLRQLHYRLVSEGAYPNTQNNYKRLSELTAEGRREGTFPDLHDRGRTIHQSASWASPGDALGALIGQYRLDRTDGQDVSVFLGVEKAGLIEQVSSWFGHLGIPIIALGGYASQSYVDLIGTEVAQHERPAVLLYAGDFDPSGEDIERDLTHRAAYFDKVERVALTAEQVEQHGLPANPGKVTDSRAAAFVVRHGALVQVEVDALEPDTLRALFAAALAHWWDGDAYEEVLEQEVSDLSELQLAIEAVR